MKNRCLFMILILIHKGSSLMCYECSTLFDEDGDCGEDFEPEDIEKTECDGDDICVIHVAPPILQFPEIRQRGCIERSYCNKIDEFNEHCLTCDEDLCNSSSIAGSSFMTVVFFVIVKKFYFNKMY